MKMQNLKQKGLLAMAFSWRDQLIFPEWRILHLVWDWVERIPLTQIYIWSINSILFFQFRPAWVVDFKWQSILSFHVEMMILRQEKTKNITSANYPQILIMLHWINRSLSNLCKLFYGCYYNYFSNYFKVNKSWNSNLFTFYSYSLFLLLL